MRDFGRKALALVEGKTRDDLEKDEVLCLALTRLVELVGEAASQIPPEYQKKNPQVPWPKIVHMRHRLIHGYDSIDLDILWNAVTTNIPLILDELDRLISEEK